MDIGANLGAFAIPVAKDISHAGGEVYAFEPQKIIYYQLCANILINKLANVSAVNAAIGSADGYIDVPLINVADSENIGAFSLNESLREMQNQGNSYVSESHTVELKRLDNLKILKSPSFIKIDVEGFEENVIRGAINFLEQHGFPPFVFEAWNEPWYKSKKESLFALIKSIGYSIEWIWREDYLAQHPNHSSFVDVRHVDENSLSFAKVK